jgi:HK97 family phage major capsid protein
VAITFAIPDTRDAMQEFLTAKDKAADRKQLFATGADPKDLVQFMTQYANLSNKADASVGETVKEQVQRAMADYARSRDAELRVGDRKATAADVRTQRQSATYKSGQVAPGRELNGKFDDLWDYLEVISQKSIAQNKDVERRTLIENAMSSVDPASGGFLIPEEFRATLMQVALASAVVRPRATVIPMTTLRISMPIVDVTSNQTSVFGGIIGYWTEEGAALTQTQPQFGRVSLEAKKLTAYTAIPNELRRDSAISVDTLLNTMMPQGVSWFEDIAFMFGSGSGEPIGVFTAGNSALVSVAARAGQGTVSGAGADIIWENIIDMYSRMLPTSLGSAVWVVSPAALPQLFTLALNVGTGGAALGPVVSTMGTGAPVLTLLGAPIIVNEKVGNLGTAGDLNFVDFGQYLIGDRMQMEAEQSTDYLFGNDMTAYRFIERVDGRPWMQSAITPRNGGPTLSPYIQLAARP